MSALGQQLVRGTIDTKCLPEFLPAKIPYHLYAERRGRGHHAPPKYHWVTKNREVPALEVHAKFAIALVAHNNESHIKLAEVQSRPLGSHQVGTIIPILASLTGTGAKASVVVDTAYEEWRSKHLVGINEPSNTRFIVGYIIFAYSIQVPADQNYTENWLALEPVHRLIPLPEPLQEDQWLWVVSRSWRCDPVPVAKNPNKSNIPPWQPISKTFLDQHLRDERGLFHRS